jgi:hypothetical protein
MLASKILYNGDFGTQDMILVHVWYELELHYDKTDQKNIP